jgi:hypothetical protein
MGGKLLTKRRFPRRRYKQPVGILLQGRYTLAPGEEVGEGGLSLFAPSKAPDGHYVVVTFALEGDLHIMKGEIRYQVQQKDGTYLYGIAFQDIDFKYKKLIRRYIGAKTEDELLPSLKAKVL